MFQRLKGAIDSRIAEEQARQRAAIQSVSSGSDSFSAQRPRSRTLSPSKRPVERGKTDPPAERGPEPSEFDTDFTADDGITTSWIPENGTFQQNVESQKSALETSTTVPETGTRRDSREDQTHPQRPGVMSTEVLVKLRKAERLEGKYQELLSAYRVAHARAQTVESFEVSLRENTPLTSINDPGALLEYLNQMTLKSNMVLDELKRVATERDSYCQKVDELKQKSQSLEDTISKLEQGESHPKLPAEHSASTPVLSDLPVARNYTNPAAAERMISVKTPTHPTSSRTPSASVCSAESKEARSSREEKDTSEEIFSYDNELPLLEAELRERVAEISDLKKQEFALRGDLSVARESTEGMVQSLEAATQELHALRDVNEHHVSARKELQMKIESLEQKSTPSTSHHTGVTQEDHNLKSQMKEVEAVLKHRNAALSSEVDVAEETRSQLNFLDSQRTELREKVAQKEATLNFLEDSLAMSQLEERQQQGQSGSESTSQKQITILSNVTDSLRSQLRTAEGEISELKQAKKRAGLEVEDLLRFKAQKEEQEEPHGQFKDGSFDRYKTYIAEQPSTKYFGFVNTEEFSLSGDPVNAMRQFSKVVKNMRPELYDALTSPQESKATSAVPTETPNVPDDTTKKNKKKKKKKKNKSGQDSAAEQAIHNPPAKVTETLDKVDDEDLKHIIPRLAASPHLEKQIGDLKHQIEERNARIDDLSTRLKDQQMLDEEVETLRDDLLHQGEGHVEAREALKVANLEKAALEGQIIHVQREFLDLKTRCAAHSAEYEKEQSRVLTEFGALKTMFEASQSDLAAAERLATARFKDVTDLRELLSKVQPEVRTLRARVEELEPAKEDLESKIGELARLESSHEHLKAEIRNANRRSGEKDAEIRNIRQKLLSENAARTKAEQDLRITRTDFEDAESAKGEALNTLKQASDDISKAKADVNTETSRNRELQDTISKYVRETESLKEGIALRTSLHDSSQALVAGLREQTVELSAQAREASSRADSLEEELAEAQRMLAERSREGETMRRLISDMEGRASTKIRDMTEQMEAAIEERDKVEDEASISNRRMTREVEELRNKAKEATTSLKAAEEEKEELERSQTEFQRTKKELKAAEERALSEVAEIHAAMQQLRESSELRDKECIELERQHGDAKRMLEEVHERTDRLQRANRSLTDELKSLQQRDKQSIRPPTGPPNPGMPSSPSSTDSTAPNAHESGLISSPGPNMRGRLPGSGSSTPSSQHPSTIDYIYLKNVLLQFLEQKDKSHQKQLIPVLGMLLNFDRKDEQRWMAAITGK